jgi:S-adenosylmethionine:tRNA ribosyltransferase-isomerase
MKTDDLDFDLPPDLIAQTPPADRDHARLLRYLRGGGIISHHRFDELPSLLRRGDLLVFNDARVIPARFSLRKKSGGQIEATFLAEPHPGSWLVLLKDAGHPKVGTTLEFDSDPNLSARIAQIRGGGEYLLEISPPGAALPILDRLGRMPLPPYIKRDKRLDPRDPLDRQRYQTVFAAAPGAVAAPTAGLHFTPQLLRALDAAAIGRAMITLHVGPGTFRPITTETLEAHTMHSEAYRLDQTAADQLNRAKSEGRRIIAVGTTAARVLESQPPGVPFAPIDGQTDIFIYPPYRWKHVDGLITNFHLPRSTLIALVAALIGLPEQRRIYREAIERRYRFFSYGDAMLIE